MAARDKRGGVSSQLMKTPLRKPRALSNLPVNNSRDWVSVLSSLMAPKNKHLDIKLNVPHTVLISSNGNPCSWYYTSQKAGLKKRNPKNLTVDAFRAKFKELLATGSEENPDKIIAILRHGFSSRLLNAAALETFFDQLQHKTFGAEDELPFCVQEYIEPCDNARYVTTYQETLKGDYVCESFVCEYSARYKKWVAQDTLEASSTTNASYLEHSPLKEAELMNTLKKRTTMLVNVINKGQTETRLQGIVCEYIIGETDGKLYLHAILGTHFSGASTSSWDNSRTLNPDAELICNMIGNVPDTNALASTVPSGAMTSSAMYNSEGQRVPRPPGSSSSFQRPHTSGGRLHAPIHRHDRPGLVVELSRQLEIYRTGLEVARAECQEAETRSRAQQEEAQQEEDKYRGLQQEMATLVADHGHREDELHNEIADLEADINRLLQAEANAAEGLRDSEKEQAELERALDDERATAFGLLGGLQRNIAKLEASLEKSHDSMRELHHEQKKLAQDAQLEISQNSELTEQLSRASDLADALSKSKNYHTKYCAALSDTNEKLSRYQQLQDATAAVRRQAKHLQVHVKDLVASTLNPSAELELAKQLLLKHTPKLKPIFFFYANTEVSHGSPLDAKTMTLGEVSKFVRDCKITNQSGFSQASMDIIMQQSHYSDRILYFHEFQEVLLRIANAKYPHIDCLGARLEAFLAEEVYVNAKKKTHKELVKDGHIKH